MCHIPGLAAMPTVPKLELSWWYKAAPVKWMAGLLDSDPDVAWNGSPHGVLPYGFRVSDSRYL
jgi:hypothetical protein